MAQTESFIKAHLFGEILPKVLNTKGLHEFVKFGFTKDWLDVTSTVLKLSIQNLCTISVGSIHHISEDDYFFFVCFQNQEKIAGKKIQIL